MTSIGKSAFECCSELTSVTIPEGVTSIGSDAFYLCEGLTSVTIPLSVTSIGDYAFDWCCGLPSMTIPSGVTSIGQGAFYACHGLKQVKISSNVTSIGDTAFGGCGGIDEFIVDARNPNYKSENGLLLSKDGTVLIAGVNREVMIPSTVTSIGDYAFELCDGLTCVTIPSGVKSIGNGAFRSCGGLNEFIVDARNPNFMSVNGLLLSKDGNVLIAGINGDVKIPTSVTSIGYRVFDGCSGLTSVTIPSSVTSIGNYAFNGCVRLTSVTIPSSVTSIGNYAFCGCGKLPSVTIPSSVTSIGNGAFVGCGWLTSVTIPSSVSAIGGSAFLNCRGLKTVYVSSGDTSRVRNLMSASGFSVEGVEFIDSATTYTVTFNANGGLGTMASQTITCGVSTALKANAFTHSGYTFAGWSKTAGGSVAYANGASVSNLAPAGGSITLYAVWTPQAVPPSAPTGVSVTDGLYADCARVTWSAVSGATSYNLYRSTTTSRPSAVTKTGVTSPYNDTTATPGIRYYYWIAAVNSAGSSVSSYDTGYRAVSLVLGKSSDSYAAAGGTGSASVTANTSWSASANVSWITFGTSTGNGNGTVTYTVSANTSTSSRTGAITVTAGSGTAHPVSMTIAVVESEAVAAGTALNNTTLSFTTGGNASWYGQKAISHDGNSSMRSGAIGNNQSSWLQTTVRGPGTISFWWKVDSEERYDWLKLYVDGSPVNSCKISGTGSDWTQVSESISGSRSHTVQWEYSKDSSNARGEDAGFVDQVVWTPSTTFVVMFAANGGTGNVDDQAMESGSVYNLPPCTFTPPAGKTRFAGWACSNGKRYDDGMLVFNLAQPGETMMMTAIWE